MPTNIDVADQGWRHKRLRTTALDLRIRITYNGSTESSRIYYDYDSMSHGRAKLQICITQSSANDGKRQCVKSRKHQGKYSTIR